VFKKNTEGTGKRKNVGMYRMPALTTSGEGDALADAERKGRRKNTGAESILGARRGLESPGRQIPVKRW